MKQKRNTSGLRPYKKGQSGNPLGGKLHDPAMKAIKRLTKNELIEIGNFVIKGDVAALKALRKDDKTSVIKAMVASVALKAIAKGDQGAFEALMIRLIGKVKDEIEHTGSAVIAPQVIVNMPSNGREAKK